MPGLREWGSGLEALTECYFKYIKKCVVEVGRTFQRVKKIHHSHGIREVRYPFDIDLLAVKPDKRRVSLISCSQEWIKTPEKTEEEFKSYEDVLRKPNWLGFGKNIEIDKIIACVKISSNKKQKLQKKGIEVLEAKSMLEELLGLIKKFKSEKRTGAHLEPIIWLLQTLYDIGKIQ